MPTLEEFLPKVYEITDREDRVAETKSALARALRRAHNSSFYHFDTRSFSVPNQGNPQFSLLTPDRFRAIGSIQGFRTSGLMTPNDGFRVREISAEAVLDPQVQMDDKGRSYYLAGNQIFLLITEPYASVSIEYFIHPKFEDSYIAANLPEMVTYNAASLVMLMLKDTAGAATWKQLADEMYVELERYAYKF